MSAILSIYSTVSSRLSSLPVVDGQLIFVSDSKEIYFDMNGLRVKYNILDILHTEEQRELYIAPSEGFYFVEETSIFYRFHEGEWIQISPSNLDPIFIGDFEDFPSIGNIKTLYVTDDALYKWDQISRNYLMVSNKTIWQRMEI